MDYYNSSIKKAIKYIEENLNEQLDLNNISKAASYSPYHFSRVFKQATGENINNMIKRLRLAQSTHELLFQNSSITEIGLNIGYETPSSFNKAFKKLFNMSPREYKKQTEENLKNHFQELKIKPEIIDIKEDIYTLFDRSLGEYNDAAIEAWNKLISKEEHLKEINYEFLGKRYFGLCYDNPNITEYDYMRYEACLLLDNEELPKIDSRHIKILPKGRYVVLKYIGSYDNLYNIWFQFYGWVYNKNLQLSNFPPVEEYLDNPEDILEGNIKYNTTNLMLKLD
ncbi:AraC family transcriptional regulator [Arcobacter arenosus]|uniref:AraC family transcriptional regulator n=1 Tax=Arcobacter arenosus TaxID=2576037 RepID=UPI003BAA8C32